MVTAVTMLPFVWNWRAFPYNLRGETIRNKGENRLFSIVCLYPNDLSPIRKRSCGYSQIESRMKAIILLCYESHADGIGEYCLVTVIGLGEVYNLHITEEVLNFLGYGL